jgi:hypothetical protein
VLIIEEIANCGEEGRVSSGGTPPPVFCKRVRKPLIKKELREYSFLKSAQEFENKGLNFSLFSQESERVVEERVLNAAKRSA